MPSAGQITVTLDAKTAQFLSAVSKAAAKLQGLDTTASAAGKAVKKLPSKFFKYFYLASRKRQKLNKVHRWENLNVNSFQRPSDPSRL